MAVKAQQSGNPRRARADMTTHERAALYTAVVIRHVFNVYRRRKQIQDS